MGLPSPLEHPISLGLPLSLLSVVPGGPSRPWATGLVLTSTTPGSLWFDHCPAPSSLPGTRWAAGPEDLGADHAHSDPRVAAALGSGGRWWCLFQGRFGGVSPGGCRGSRFGEPAPGGCCALGGGGTLPACAPGSLPGGHRSPLSYLCRITDALSLSRGTRGGCCGLDPSPLPGPRPLGGAALSAPHPPPKGSRWASLCEGPPGSGLSEAPVISSPAGPLPSPQAGDHRPNPQPTGMARGTTATTSLPGWSPHPPTMWGGYQVPGFASHLPCRLPPPPASCRCPLRSP